MVNHVQVEALSELARIMKPDGLICIILYDPFFQTDYMTKIGDLTKSGIVDLLSMEFIPYKREYTINFEFIFAYLIVFRVTK